MRRRAGRRGSPTGPGRTLSTFSALGGVPKAVVCDNLKAGVTVACRYEPGINRTYQELAEHYDTAILPTRPRRPRDKAKVEVAVQIVQRFVLARLRNRRFFSLHELNAAIRETVADLNAKIMRKLGVSRDELFAEMIGRHSKPFRQRPISMPSGRGAGSRPTTTLRSPITITPCRHASSASNSRRASPTPRLKSCTRVLVWRAMFALTRVVGTRQSPSTCRAHTGDTPSGAGSDEAGSGQKIGPATIALVDAIMKAKPHPEQGFRACLGILRLARSYGSARIEAACRRGNDIGATTYGSIKSILQHGLDRAYANEKPPDAPPIQHRNIRGTGYYH